MAAVTALAALDDTLVSGAADGSLREWDARSGRCLHACVAHDGPVSAIALSAAFVLSSGWDGRLKKTPLVRA